MSKLTIKEVFTACREKFCSINGAPIGRLVDENLRKEREVLALAQAIKKDFMMTFARREIAKLKRSTTLRYGEYGKGRCIAQFQEEEEDSRDDEVGIK